MMVIIDLIFTMVLNTYGALPNLIQPNFIHPNFIQPIVILSCLFLLFFFSILVWLLCFILPIISHFFKRLTRFRKTELLGRLHHYLILAFIFKVTITNPIVKAYPNAFYWASPGYIWSTFTSSLAYIWSTFTSSLAFIWSTFTSSLAFISSTFTSSLAFISSTITDDVMAVLSFIEPWVMPIYVLIEPFAIVFPVIGWSFFGIISYDIATLMSDLAPPTEMFYVVDPKSVVAATQQYQRMNLFNDYLFAIERGKVDFLIFWNGLKFTQQSLLCDIFSEARLIPEYRVRVLQSIDVLDLTKQEIHDFRADFHDTYRSYLLEVDGHRFKIRTEPILQVFFYCAAGYCLVNLVISLVQLA